jgi:hypothetical protein
MWHVRGRGKMPAEFWWRKLKNRNSLEDTGMFGTITLNRFIWLRVCTSQGRDDLMSTAVREKLDVLQNAVRWGFLTK